MTLNPTLRESLDHTPVVLRFGTSGRRGKVQDLSQLEIYINVRGEMAFLLDLPRDQGGVALGDTVYIGYDLRPSSVNIVADEDRGALLQAVIAAVQDAGMKVVNLGVVPTPALAAVGWANEAASIMITGSHIPFDRNGYKLNTSVGELLKSHEEPIDRFVTTWRDTIYRQDASTSVFDAHGMLRTSIEVPLVHDDLARTYVQRYHGVFGSDALAGLTVLFYEHSSAGRKLLPQIFQALGASVILRGRSDAFVPVDTENLQPDMLAWMQQLADEVTAEGTKLDAVLSADGDADRPLLMAVENGKLRFVPGDTLGMLAAELLQPDAVVVPISCNDAIDRGPLAAVLKAKTRIGSPFVIDGLNAARAQGAVRACGWEPNGGFLLGSDLEMNGEVLPALPTRDAALPLIAILLLAKLRGTSVAQVFDSLPARYGATALLKDFPRPTAMKLLERVTPAAGSGVPVRLVDLLVPAVLSDVTSIDTTDGVRVTSSRGEVVHLRPSGNADEFRIYSVADTLEDAKRIASAGSDAVAQASSKL